MKISLREIVPRTWILEEKENVTKAWFSAERGNHNRKAIFFPKEVIIDAEFMEGLVLCLGDGDMHRKEKRHFNYVSKDLDIITLFYDFFVKSFLWIKKR